MGQGAAGQGGGQQDQLSAGTWSGWKTLLPDPAHHGLIVHHRPITSHSALSSLCLGGKQEELRASLKTAQDLGISLLRVTLGSGAPAARGKAEGC